jgi:hypothetical protein
MPRDHHRDQRIRAVAFLSRARALLDCAVEELAGVPNDPGHLADVRRDLDYAADHLMEPFEVARILDTIEDALACGGLTPDVGPEEIVSAVLDVRACAREDEAA